MVAAANHCECVRASCVLSQRHSASEQPFAIEPFARSLQLLARRTNEQTVHLCSVRISFLVRRAVQQAAADATAGCDANAIPPLRRLQTL